MSAWSDFRLEVLGDPYEVWHDGADFSELASRFVLDPSAVLELLQAGILEGDAVAATACRYLAPTPALVPSVVAVLEATLASAYGSTRTEIAASLHALGASSPVELADSIVSVLASSDHWGVRLDAARRLALFAPTPALVAALAAGVRDEEYLVRFHSANTLLHWASREGEISADPELFALLAADDAPGSWASVATRLAAAVPV